jgi:cystathionine gamma-synthase
MKKKAQHIETISIHAGMDHGSESKSIVPPMEPSTNFEHAESGYQEGDYIYTRDQNPNRLQLEQTLTQLEKGEDCAAFSSGIAAINSVLMTVKRGGHVIIPVDVYHGTRALLHQYSEQWGITYSETDTTDLEHLEAACKEETALCILESPSNPLMQITDLEKAIRLLHSKDIIVCVDNTFATPYNTNPIELGADLVMHSTSKYLGGHSDILGGAIIAGASGMEFFENIKQIQKSQGAVPSPRDCWLLSRSIRSFPYRMRGHNENGIAIAQFLNEHSKIETVYYPGLSTHYNHDIAKAQMTGFGGMLSFLVKGNREETLKVVASSKLIRRATSLGGVESLWEHRHSSEGEESSTPQNLIRLSVGLEHSDDIIEDISQALEAI